MKRFYLVLCLLAALLAPLPSGLAEIGIPSYASYAKLAAEDVTLTENSDTGTVQCYTDGETLAAYQALLEENGFVRNGAWKLNFEEEDAELEIVSYRYMGKEQPRAFPMTVQETSFTCHVLLQTVKQPNGGMFLSMTWSQDIAVYDYIWPDPSATAEPYICPFCNQGVCKDCNGTGQIRCINCEGSGTCPICHGTGKYWGVECQGCHGDRKCWRCNGSGKEACFSCDNGVCSFCHGDYTNPLAFLN